MSDDFLIAAQLFSLEKREKSSRKYICEEDGVLQVRLLHEAAARSSCWKAAAARSIVQTAANVRFCPS